jgi:hypothetical protein
MNRLLQTKPELIWKEHRSTERTNMICDVTQQPMACRENNV